MNFTQVKKKGKQTNKQKTSKLKVRSLSDIINHLPRGEAALQVLFFFLPTRCLNSYQYF